MIVGKRLHPPAIAKKERKRLWLHGVSVGEVVSLYPLANLLEEKGIEVLVSTTTSTGMEIARKKLAKFYLFHFPFDLPFVVRKFLRVIDPNGIVIAETELWPNFINESWRMGIPIFLVNGRVSEGSLRGYRKLRPFMKNLLGKFNLICVQSEDYREKFIDIGAAPSKVVVTGNMKADFEIGLSSAEFPIDEPYMVVGSTMSREEDRFVLEAYKDAKLREKLVIAPRHPERTWETFEETAKFGFKVQKKSKVEKEWDVLVLDTMGELPHFYSKAELSIIGGSIGEFGGHNLLEPAYFGSPIAFGPHMENFRDLSEEFLREKAAIIFKTKEELSNIMRIAVDGKLAEKGKKGREVLNKLKGATKKNAELILAKI